MTVQDKVIGLQSWEYPSNFNMEHHVKMPKMFLLNYLCSHISLPSCLDTIEGRAYTMVFIKENVFSATVTDRFLLLVGSKTVEIKLVS